eukprot:PhM_4_TR17326/c0_g1_i1/m.42366
MSHITSSPLLQRTFVVIISPYFRGFGSALSIIILLHVLYFYGFDDSSRTASSPLLPISKNLSPSAEDTTTGLEASNDNNNNNKQYKTYPFVPNNGGDEEEDENNDNFCGKHVDNCFDPRCYAKWKSNHTTGCTANPYFSTFPRTEPPEEVKCKHRRHIPDNRARLGVVVRDGDGLIFPFQRHTSWMFEKWYDWAEQNNATAECRPTTAERMSVRMRGRYRPDGLYELQNFCLSPMGPLTGYDPKISPYRGMDENDFIEHGVERGINEWFMRSERLKTPPTCFVDIPRMVLFPHTLRAQSPSHNFYRAASLMRTIEAAFGVKARDQQLPVTMVHVVTRAETDHFHTFEGNKKLNFQRYFYDMLGTSWFSVFGGSEWLENKNLKQLFGFEPDRAVLQRPVCFRSAILWQSSTYGNKQRGALSSTLPHHKTQFPLFGPRGRRDVQTLQIMERKLTQCLGLEEEAPPRDHADLTHTPTVLYVIRSTTRRMAFQPYIVDFIQAYLRNKVPGAKLVVIEDSRMGLRDIVKTFRNADIVFGPTGTGLLWSLFMPPGGLLLDMSTSLIHFAQVQGFNRAANTVDGEFGGGAFIARHFYGLVIGNGDLTHLHTHITGSHCLASYVTPRHMKVLFDKIFCIAHDKDSAHKLKTHHNNDIEFHISATNEERQNRLDVSGYVNSVQEECQFDADLVERLPRISTETTLPLSKSERLTVEADAVRRLIALHQPPRIRDPFYSTRLELLMVHTEEFVDRMSVLRHRTLPTNGDTTVLLLDALTDDGERYNYLPCGVDFRHLAEARCLQDILPRVQVVTVAIFASSSKKQEKCHDDVGEKMRKQNEKFGLTVRTCVFPCRGVGPFDLVLLTLSAKSNQHIQKSKRVSSLFRSFVSAYDGAMIMFDIESRRLLFRFAPGVALVGNTFLVERRIRLKYGDDSDGVTMTGPVRIRILKTEAEQVANRIERLFKTNNNNNKTHHIAVILAHKNINDTERVSYILHNLELPVKRIIVLTNSAKFPVVDEFLDRVRANMKSAESKSKLISLSHPNWSHNLLQKSTSTNTSLSSIVDIIRDENEKHFFVAFFFFDDSCSSVRMAHCPNASRYKPRTKRCHRVARSTSGSRGTTAAPAVADFYPLGPFRYIPCPTFIGGHALGVAFFFFFFFCIVETYWCERKGASVE